MKLEFAIWLVDYLMDNGATLKDIEKAWSRSSLYEKPVPRTLFHLYRRKTEEIFGIDIVCDRRTNKYYIKNQDILKTDPLKNWLLSSMSAVTTIERSKALSNRIMLEPTYGGEGFLPQITEAMSVNCCLQIVYKPFWHDEPYQFVLDPYFIRLFKQRWYLIGFSHKHHEVRTFAFDRMKKVEMLKETFSMPEGADVKSFFLNSFGIMQQDNIPVSSIRLRFIAEQGMYIKTKPLHHSQHLLSMDSDYMVFEYRLRPTFDFFQEVLSYGSDVEVLAPDSFRQQVAECVRWMTKIYGCEE